VVIYRGSKVEQGDVELPDRTSTGAQNTPPLPSARADAALAIHEGS
jgi:hypothetical protein